MDGACLNYFRALALDDISNRRAALRLHEAHFGNQHPNSLRLRAELEAARAHLQALYQLPAQVAA